MAELLLSPRATEREEQPLTPTQPYSGFVGMYNFKGNLGKGHYAVVKLAEVSSSVRFCEQLSLCWPFQYRIQYYSWRFFSRGLQLAFRSEAVRAGGWPRGNCCHVH